MSALIVIDASPAEFKDGYVTIRLSLMAQSNLYRKEFEANRLSDVEAEFAQARAALDGQHDAAIYARVRRGRKPNGFDAWYDGLGKAKYTHKAVQP